MVQAICMIVPLLQRSGAVTIHQLHTTAMTGTMDISDIYRQQRMHYKDVMMINNEGVALLQNGNLERAFSTFQGGIMQSLQLLLSTRAAIRVLHNTSSNNNHGFIGYPHYNSNAQTSATGRNIRDCSSYHQYSVFYPHHDMRSDQNGRLVSPLRRNVDRPNRGDVQQQECYEWLDMLYASILTSSSPSVQLQMPIHQQTKMQCTTPSGNTGGAHTAATSPGRRSFCFGPALKGLATENCYIHDRPFLFPDDFIDERCGARHDSTGLIDTHEIIRAMTIPLINFALTHHYQGKIYGHSKSYRKAIELYYLLWSISQSWGIVFSPIYSINHRWYMTIQCIFLNNLVHVHDELENFVESKICVTCLYDLIVWKLSQQRQSDDILNGCASEINPTPQITYERINRISYLEQNEFDKILENIMYFEMPVTARAA